MDKKNIDVSFHTGRWVNGIVVLINTDIFEGYVAAAEKSNLFEAVGRDLDDQIREQLFDQDNDE